MTLGLGFLEDDSGLELRKTICFMKILDRDMIINKCHRFYDLKSNKRYIFSMKSRFSSAERKFKATFTFTKSVHAMFL